MKKNVTFTLFLLFLRVLLNAQTADEMLTLLQSKTVSYAQAAGFVLKAADLTGDESSEQDALRFAVAKKWLPKKADARDAISLGRLSLLVMKAFNVKGGPMYSMFGGAHYSYRELVFQDVIQGRSDPQMKVTGEKMIFIVNRLLFRIEENPWKFTEDPVALTAEKIRMEEIVVMGYGSEKPIADNKTKEGMALNRRVEITLLENE